MLYNVVQSSLTTNQQVIKKEKSMTQQTISVTRALVELKRYNDRVTQAIAVPFVSITVGKEANQKVLNSNKTVSAVSLEIQGAFDKVEALIKNREKLKAAIVKSNAETQVELLGRSMSVAEAIELKTSVELRSALLSQLRRQLLTAKTAIERANVELEAKIDASLNTVYGSEKSKIAEDLVKQIATPQRNQKEQNLLDPCGIEDKIEKLQDEVSAITSELDFVLSESNARTLITVEL
jgi:hypothetical protein